MKTETFFFHTKCYYKGRVLITIGWDHHQRAIAKLNQLKGPIK